MFLPKSFVAALCVVGLAVPVARADTFGTGVNTFTIDFVTVGNPGNGKDLGAGGGSFSTPYGAVAFTYRMGVTEVPRDWITIATGTGIPAPQRLTEVTAGPWVGKLPATGVTWYEAAALVNWLNTIKGAQRAYNLTNTGGFWSLAPWSSAEAFNPGTGLPLNLYRHKNARYFLPSEDEWYKAAYHKNDGVTANYWDFATASNTIPTAVATGTAAGTAVFGTLGSAPAPVDAVGGASAYGTRGQNGNVYEWTESDFDGINDDGTEGNSFGLRTTRGGSLVDTDAFLRSSYRNSSVPAVSDILIGFRVAALTDTDGDGIPDKFETGTGIYVSPTNTGTSPTNPDTDGDGLSDGLEVDTYLTNPLVSDTDGDGLSDGAEVNTHQTNPRVADTDGDGLSDGAEVNTHQTNPRAADTDGDGLSDGAEVNTHQTNPRVADTDGDGLSDGAEVNTYFTNPKLSDTDGDGFSDGFEVTAGLSPISAASTPESASSIIKVSPTTVEFRFNAANGISYRIEASADLVTWSTLEPVVIGSGGPVTRPYSTMTLLPRRFFRCRRN